MRYATAAGLDTSVEWLTNHYVALCAHSISMSVFTAFRFNPKAAVTVLNVSYKAHKGTMFAHKGSIGMRKVWGSGRMDSLVVQEIESGTPRLAFTSAGMPDANEEFSVSLNEPSGCTGQKPRTAL
ncbi:MAG: hypothetical protein MUF81_16850 [Verrucomicrobia bacterium]|nr:hypothetical protein [Verrucomicrobiota bacterium]